MSSSILSTHSGHHRIFIGPVVQGRNNNNNNNANVTVTNTTSNHGHHKHNHTQPKHGQAQAPKPWWEQESSFFRSHLSLHNISTTGTTTTPPLTNSSRTTPATTPSPQQHPASSQRQTNIPQFSYTFSDDDEHSSCSSSEEGDEEVNAYDSEDERRDYTRDRDVNDDDDDEQDRAGNDDNGINNEPHGANPPFHNSSSSESFSAPVAAGHSNSRYNQHQQPQQQHGQQSSEESGQLQNVDSKGNPIKNKGKDKDTDAQAQALAQDDAYMSRTKSVKRWRTGGKKRTKSMRDEGEPNRLKKILGSRRDRRQNDEPDLGWESDGSRASRPRLGRQMTSGALLAGHHHDRQEHHSVLVSSPMSSEVNLPATNGPIYVSSPVSSAVDVSNPSNLERPDPRPIQNLGSAAGVGTGSDLLAPGWKSHSNSSLSSSGTPRNSNVQRGTTWMTAREYSSSFGQGSLYDKAIEEENESDENNEDNDHYSLAKTTSRATDWEDAEEGIPNQGTSNGAPNVTNPAAKDETATDATSKEPLSASISKAGTLFSRTLLRRAPTGLKTQEGEADKPKVARPVESICSIDKDCQTAAVEPSNKKHVRFLTKVQNPISSSRQPTMLSTNPVVKQDRMLVRKEMTERPGPHVFNSDTARRFELQSEGWKEWWCVMKGPPVGPKPPVNKIRRRSKRAKRVEKGRLEFFYNHKKIKGTVILSSHTTVSVYSSLDYSIAVTQNYPEAVGLTVYILRPRTISLACAWYMEIYTLLNGKAPIPSFIEIAVPDFDVKIRVPIPEDSDTETESDTDSDSQDQGDNDDNEDNGRSTLVNDTSLSITLPPQDTPLQSFKTARTSLPERLASKTFYLKNDDARPTLVAPDEVTPRLLRSHVLALLKDVPDWTEVVKMWRDPSQFGDVALCWKRYDRIEWIYWGERIPGETDNLHLKKEHIGFADGSEWVGGMDETVVGPQVLDKTHLLELRPITHYPTKARTSNGMELHEPDPIEGYLVRVSTFSGNPIRRFRRLYLTSHDHMLIYTVPSQSHSPTMQHAGAIDPTALIFCISPHHSANPDHKDMAQSRSVRRLKAQVRSARGYIDMTKIADVRVLTNQEWETVRHLPYDKKDKQNLTKRERLGKAVQRVAVAAQEARARAEEANATGDIEVQEQPQMVMKEPDHYFFNAAGIPDASESLSSGGQQNSESTEQQQQSATDLDSNEPLNASLSKRPEGVGSGHIKGSSSTPTFKDSIVRSTTFMADLLLHNDAGVVDQADEDSNVIEIEMMEGPCVRFRAFNAEAAHLWRDQLEKLAEYWRLRKHLDVKDHMAVAQANYQLASSLDDDEIQVGETIQDWDNDRAVVSPEIWNWCVVNGCRSVTRSGYLYYKPRLHSTFRKIFMVLTEGMLMMFHPHRRSKASGQLIPTTACKLLSVHSLTDIYIYSGHFSDEDTSHGTNDESERLPRFYPDGLIVDDPDEDCTFSIWRGKRRKMFSRRGAALTTMSSKAMTGSSRIFGKDGLLSSIVKQGVVYGSSPQSCAVFRARSRPDLEQWVYAINTEIERVVRAERRRVRGKGHSHQHY